MIAAVEIVAVKGVEYDVLAHFPKSDPAYSDYVALIPGDVMEEPNSWTVRVLRRKFRRDYAGAVLTLYVDVFQEARKPAEASA